MVKGAAFLQSSSCVRPDPENPTQHQQHFARNKRSSTTPFRILYTLHQVPIPWDADRLLDTEGPMPRRRRGWLPWLAPEVHIYIGYKTLPQFNPSGVGTVLLPSCFGKHLLDVLASFPDILIHLMFRVGESCSGSGSITVIALPSDVSLSSTNCSTAKQRHLQR